MVDAIQIRQVRRGHSILKAGGQYASQTRRSATTSYNSVCSNNLQRALALGLFMGEMAITWVGPGGGHTLRQMRKADVRRNSASRRGSRRGVDAKLKNNKSRVCADSRKQLHATPTICIVYIRIAFSRGANASALQGENDSDWAKQQILNRRCGAAC